MNQKLDPGYIYCSRGSEHHFGGFCYTGTTTHCQFPEVGEGGGVEGGGGGGGGSGGVVMVVVVVHGGSGGLFVKMQLETYSLVSKMCAWRHNMPLPSAS